MRTKVSRLGSPFSAVAGFRVFRPPKKLGKNGTPIFAPTKISLKKYVDETLVGWSILTPSVGYTSSTAQGGGGSFKKRKTIGEIACCDSRMSEQKH